MLSLAAAVITIHCGLHKTGSSSIQLALPLVERMARRRVVTPSARDDRSEAGWESRFRSLLAYPDGVFSDENVLGDPYDAYALAPARLALLRESLAGSRYQLVVYLRPQVDWLGSLYLQGVQEGRTTSSEDFLASMDSQPLLSWANLVRLLQEHSGAERVVVRAHTRSRDSVEDFFRIAGLGSPPRVSRSTIRENASISACQAPILVALNEDAALTRDERVRRRHIFQGMLAAPDPSPMSPFPPSLQRDVAEHYRADWIEVADIIGRCDADEAAVFQEEVARWDEPTRLFPGASITDPRIAAELLRCLTVLVGEVGPPTAPGRWSRLWAKVRHNPTDIPRALGARVRRAP